jgi:hypothetical protein
MLCTRCQQREAMMKGLTPETRAKAEELFGMPWPLPENVCKACLEELSKDPAFKVRLNAFTKAAGAKARVLLEKDVRETALKVLDFADRLAGRM